MKRASRFLTSMVLATFAVSAQAAVIDFEGFSTGTFTHLEEDGFQMNWIGFGDLQTVVDDGGNQYIRDSNQNAFGAEIVISRIDGQQFYFNSFDYNNVGTGSAIALRVNVNGGLYQTIGSGTTGFVTMTYGLGPVNSIGFNIISGSANYGIDNINVTAVPAPVALGLFALGLIMLGARRRVA